MAAESAADRLAMLDDDDWATEATVGGSTVKGIFDDGYVQVDMGGHVVESSKPTFFCRSADLPAITNNSTEATIDGTTYVVIEERPDGTGMTELELREKT